MALQGHPKAMKMKRRRLDVGFPLVPQESNSKGGARVSYLTPEKRCGPYFHTRGILGNPYPIFCIKRDCPGPNGPGSGPRRGGYLLDAVVLDTYSLRYTHKPRRHPAS